ncbi:unnamed protein product [Microthlaspi erraticum]|uniref:Uncharacterized protein n=1 Tax=Microthlaspi erraticum TaxID=1685480 RepID=A0A6D2HLW4_9BRAS|nr:unnamed protein product [Microthlaspi erraticum]
MKEAAYVGEEGYRDNRRDVDKIHAQHKTGTDYHDVISKGQRNFRSETIATYTWRGLGIFGPEPVRYRVGLRDGELERFEHAVPDGKTIVNGDDSDSVSESTGA